MLQAFYLDVIYKCMLQAYVSKCFQVFHTYVCECFIWMLHMFAMVFKFFQTFSQVFHLSSFLLYVATVASGCFKNKLSVAHGMRVGSGQAAGDADDVRGDMGNVRSGAGTMLVRSVAN
jgi:hypothetical protein